jgi:hypothetical protein
MAKVVEHLPSMHEGLGSIPNTTSPQKTQKRSEAGSIYYISI